MSIVINTLNDISVKGKDAENFGRCINTLTNIVDEEAKNNAEKEKAAKEKSESGE